VAESTIAVVAATLVAAVNGAAAILGAVRWYRVEESRAFWVLVRAGQVTAVLLAVLAGVLAAVGFSPSDGLFWLYSLLPVAVGFVAEQLRIVSAEQVLENRGLENAQAVGRLDAAAQRSVVVAILRREMGVMALATGVVAFLALRAAMVA
jgi:hypothetical protein